MLFRSQKIKQHKSVGVLIVCHFFVVTIVTSQLTSDTCHGSTISLADCLRKLNHAQKVGQLYRSSDAGFIAARSGTQNIDVCFCWNLNKSEPLFCYQLVNCHVHVRVTKIYRLAFEFGSQLTCDGVGVDVLSELLAADDDERRGNKPDRRRRVFTSSVACLHRSQPPTSLPCRMLLQLRELRVVVTTDLTRSRASSSDDNRDGSLPAGTCQQTSVGGRERDVIERRHANKCDGLRRVVRRPPDTTSILAAAAAFTCLHLLQSPLTLQT